MIKTEPRRTALLAAPILGAAVFLTIGGAGAGEPVVTMDKAPLVPVEPSKSRFEEFADKLWSYPVLYSNKDNPVLQQLAFIGRYQGQYHYTAANTGDQDRWANRRFRFGLAAKMFNTVTIQGQMNLKRRYTGTTNPLHDGRFIESLEEADIKWAPTENFFLQVGKMKPKIMQEWGTSSKRILTFERSLLVNQLLPAKSGGVRVGGNVGKWSLEAGGYMAGIDTDWLTPKSDKGYFFLGRVGYELTEHSDLRFDYLYNDGDELSLATKPYKNTFSLNSTSKWDRWGLNTDLIYAEGIRGASNVWGVVLMPWYDITEKLRLVGRYQYASGDSGSALRLQSRYERLAVKDGSSVRGRNYNAVYAGLNYYLYGDKFKFMLGGEYSHMGGDADFNGFTFLTGVRMYF